ncbi:MAG: hypothetical protein OXH06_20050 [Gemmatimonadetes bacterium]|nr:hypothetical protein [Gemmatimonadota bacterium]
MSAVGDNPCAMTKKWVVVLDLSNNGKEKLLDETLEKLHRRLVEIAPLEEEALESLEKITTCGPLFCRWHLYSRYS